MKLVSIANILIAASSQNFHHAAGKALEDMGKIIKADLLYLYFYDNHKKRAVNTHQWQPGGSEFVPKGYGIIPFHDITPILKMHLNNQAVIMPPILPGYEKAALLFVFKKHITQTVALFPLALEGKCYGFVGCNYISSEGSLNHESHRFLKAFVDMLTRAIVRCKQEKAPGCS